MNRHYRFIAPALCFICTLATPLCAQWQILNSGTTADLRGIDNVGRGVAWASGTNGTVLRTEDGGYLWQSCTVPPGAEKLDFRGIQAFDANTAIVMSSGTGDLSRLYKTTDGCQTWKLLFTNPDKDGFWDAIFINQWASDGFILGDPVEGAFALFQSDDSGDTWRRVAATGLNEKGGAGAFAASNSSIAMSEDDYLLVGTGGTMKTFVYREKTYPAFSKVGVPIACGSPSAGVFSIEGRDSLHLVAVGGDYLKPDVSARTAAHTNDSGKTWLPAQTPPHGFRSAVAYDEASKTWITVGPNGTDVSTDDGKNWHALHPDAALHEPADADRNWNALSLPYVVGPHGRIGKLEPLPMPPQPRK
jgi:photosystem II stability/assembly factor-like uncharacterized protein